MALPGHTYIAPGILAPLPAPVAVRPIGCFCCAPVGVEEKDGEGLDLASADEEEAYRELYGDDEDVGMAFPTSPAMARVGTSASSNEGGGGRKRRLDTIDEQDDLDGGFVVKRRKTAPYYALPPKSVDGADPLALFLPRTSPILFGLAPLEELNAYESSLLPPLVINALRKSTAYPAKPGDTASSLPPNLRLTRFFPDDCHLSFFSGVYFLNRPVEPAWSIDYYRSFARFLQACGSSDEVLVYECALAGFGSLRPGGEPLSEQSYRITSRQPDKDVVLEHAAIAGPLDGFEQLPKVLQKWVLTLRKVLIWAMDWPGELSPGQVLRFIKEARPAVHLIIREFADVLRIRHLILRLERQILASPPRHPSPTEQAARTILAWLNETSDEQRKFAFFCEADGKVKDAKDGWEKWVARAKRGRKVTREELNAAAAGAGGVKKR